MESAALLEALVDLAREVGWEVSRVGRQPVLDGLSPSSSAVCRVRGKVLVFMADSDPVEVRAEVLARALRERIGDALEDRFLAPAVRACLEGREPELRASAPRET